MIASPRPPGFRPALVAAAACAALSAFAATPPASEPAPAESPARTFGTIALFPMVNMTGRAADLAPVEAEFRDAAVRGGLPLLDADALEWFFTERRVRYTAGVSRSVAESLRMLTGAQAVLIPTLDLWDPGEPPRVGISCRLVSTEPDPRVLWMETVVLAGDEHPGFFDLNVEYDAGYLLLRAVDQMVGALLGARSPLPAAKEDSKPPPKFRPKRLYVSEDRPGEPGRPVRIAVVPFTNRSNRRGAGELVLLQTVQHLLDLPNVEILEPGTIRQLLLDLRIIPARGVTLAQADSLLKLLGADLVISGTVFEYGDAQQSWTSRVEMSVLGIDAARRKVAFSAFLGGSADEGIRFFDIGRLRSGVSLSGALIDGMLQEALQFRDDPDRR